MKCLHFQVALRFMDLYFGIRSVGELMFLVQLTTFNRNKENVYLKGVFFKICWLLLFYKYKYK